MNEPKPLYRCDLCKAVDYEDPVIGCKRCGFDEMLPIATPVVQSEADQFDESARAIRNMTTEEIEAVVQGEPVAKFYCNKCGYLGSDQFPHRKSNRPSEECAYLASTIRATPAPSPKVPT